jgi:hypothetical protein
VIDSDRELQKGSPGDPTLSLRSVAVCTLAHINSRSGALTVSTEACNGAGIRLGRPVPASPGEIHLLP